MLNKNTYYQGVYAEKLALWFLRFKGYSLCARRYKTRLGEVDLIVRRGNVLAFVEVKSRKDTETGLYAIRPQSCQRIARAAQLFLQAHPRFTNYDIRFDAVVVRPYRLPYHLQDAWRV